MNTYRINKKVVTKEEYDEAVNSLKKEVYNSFDKFLITGNFKILISEIKDSFKPLLTKPDKTSKEILVDTIIEKTNSDSITWIYDKDGAVWYINNNVGKFTLINDGNFYTPVGKISIKEAPNINDIWVALEEQLKRIELNKFKENKKEEESSENDDSKFLDLIDQLKED
jgi:hypothetical protein